MRAVVAAVLWGTQVAAAQAATYVYVSAAPEREIHVYRLDLANADLSPVQVLPVGGTPGAMGVSPDRRTLMTSIRSTSQLLSCGIDPVTGRLTESSRAMLGEGRNASFVACDPTGMWVVAASYSGGTVTVHRMDAGQIRVPAVQEFSTARTAHCVTFSRDGKRVFVPHVTPNHIRQFEFNPQSGQLTEAGVAPGGTEKAGPRHLALHPGLDMAYSSDEQGSSITAYELSAEGLKPVQTLSTLPEGYRGSNTTAEIKVHPRGRFVWVSNRGHDSLAGFEVDPQTGRLAPIGHTPIEKTPRSFAIDPSGEVIISGGEGSGRLAIDRVTIESGNLERVRTVPVGASVTWVQIVSGSDD